MTDKIKGINPALDRLLHIYETEVTMPDDDTTQQHKQATQHTDTTHKHNKPTQDTNTTQQHKKDTQETYTTNLHNTSAVPARAYLQKAERRNQRVQLLFKPSTYQALTELAHTADISLNNLVNSILEDHIEQHKL